MQKVSSVNAVRLEFAHAILEARLRESFISIEYRDAKLPDNAIRLSEPLHEDTPARIVEAVENIAKKIASVASRNRCKVVVTPLKIMSADIKLTVLEFEEIK